MKFSENNKLFYGEGYLKGYKDAIKKLIEYGKLSCIDVTCIFRFLNEEYEILQKNIIRLPNLNKEDNKNLIWNKKPINLDN